MNLYMDNAATSFPKPDGVLEAVYNYMKYNGANPGRGAYSKAIEGNMVVSSTRELICDFFNFNKAENVIFTKNITESLNTLIKSCVKKGDHVLTTSMDHNSVLRPLEKLKEDGLISYDIINCNKDGYLDVTSLEKYVNNKTKFFILSHSSNVVGTIQPIEELGKFCALHNIHLILDSAQSAGIVPIDFKKFNLSALTFTGHKSLFGPQGIGGFIISDELLNISTSYMQGGTGSLSHSMTQPDFLPDKFESGTLNTPGIAGLKAGIEFINFIGIKSIKEKEDYINSYFINEISNINGMKVYGQTNVLCKTSAISINHSLIPNSDLSFYLAKDFGIMTRCGLHCAPLAHKTIGTYPNGTTRFSFGFYTDLEDIKYAIDSLNKCIKAM